MNKRLISIQKKISKAPKNLDVKHYDIYIEQMEMFEIINNRLHLFIMNKKPIGA